MRVLLVERDKAVALSIQMTLKAEGFCIYATDDAGEAEQLAREDDYDIILYDPGEDRRLELLKTLRRKQVKTPVIILSSCHVLDDKILAFRLGADDYLLKPFSYDELVARIYTVVRRMRGYDQQVIDVGALTIDLQGRSVSVDGRHVHLSGKEYQVLELLVLRKGRALTKGNILDHLYGGMDEPESKIVDVYICKLRKKLGAQAKAMIQNIWGRGYIMREPEAVAA